MILPHSEAGSTAAEFSCDSNRRAPGSAGRLDRTPPDDRAELNELVLRARTDDSVAQTELVQRYTRRISGYVRLIIRQPDAVEDVVQLVFIKMFRRLGRLRDVASFESWLFRLTRN